jgi:hypothetical protein
LNIRINYNGFVPTAEGIGWLVDMFVCFIAWNLKYGKVIMVYLNEHFVLEDGGKPSVDFIICIIIKIWL